MVLAVLPASAQPTQPRDLTLKVIVSNPKDYDGRISYRASRTTGEFRCDRGTHPFLRSGDFTLNTCRARSNAYGEREVSLDGEIREGDPTEAQSLKQLCDFHFEIYSGTHKFRTSSRCSLREDWSECGRTGPCTATVTITLK